MLIDTLGYLAAGAVLATFSVRCIKTLRVLAIISNLLFIAYAASANLSPVLMLHALLLPLNLWRLREVLIAHRELANKHLNKLHPFENDCLRHNTGGAHRGQTRAHIPPL